MNMFFDYTTYRGVVSSCTSNQPVFLMHTWRSGSAKNSDLERTHRVLSPFLLIILNKFPDFLIDMAINAYFFAITHTIVFFIKKEHYESSLKRSLFD